MGGKKLLTQSSRGNTDVTKRLVVKTFPSHTGVPECESRLWLLTLGGSSGGPRLELQALSFGPAQFQPLWHLGRESLDGREHPLKKRTTKLGSQRGRTEEEMERETDTADGLILRFVERG